MGMNRGSKECKRWESKLFEASRIQRATTDFSAGLLLKNELPDSEMFQPYTANDESLKSKNHSLKKLMSSTKLIFIHSVKCFIQLYRILTILTFYQLPGPTVLVTNTARTKNKALVSCLQLAQVAIGGPGHSHWWTDNGTPVVHPCPSQILDITTGGHWCKRRSLKWFLKTSVPRNVCIHGAPVGIRSVY